MKCLLLPFLAALALPTYVNANYLCTIDEVVWGKSRKLKEYEQFNIIAFTQTDRPDEALEMFKKLGEGLKKTDWFKN